MKQEITDQEKYDKIKKHFDEERKILELGGIGLPSTLGGFKDFKKKEIKDLEDIEVGKKVNKRHKERILYISCGIFPPTSVNKYIGHNTRTDAVIELIELYKWECLGKAERICNICGGRKIVYKFKITHKYDNNDKGIKVKYNINCHCIEKFPVGTFSEWIALLTETMRTHWTYIPMVT